MSLSSSLQVGVSGLTASQNALNTTAHNLANVGTKGYTRQQVVMADFAYQKWGVNHISTLQTGLGVNIETVRQVRSIFYDKSYRTEVGRQAFYEAQYESVQEVESMFGELEGVAFQDSLKNFWTSIQELSKQPDAIEVRATLVQNAESLLERADTIYKQLNEYQLNLNKQISDKVSRINEIATGISDLNKRISQYESNGVENANDLRDERNNLLDELGGLVNITYKENSNGVVTVSAEDMPLVTETGTNKMGVAKVSDSSDFLKPVWVAFNTDVFNLDRPSTTENQSDIGSLRGLLVARGSEKANYTDIPVKPVEADYTDQNQYKADLAAYEVKAAEYNKNVNVSVIMTTQAQFDQLIHGMVTAINDILSPNKEIEQAVIGGVVTVDADGNQIVKVGGDVVKDAIVKPDGTIVKKIKVLDEEKAPYGMDIPGHTQGEALFNRKSTERYSEESIQVYDASGTLQTVTVKKYNEEDPSDIYSLFTLGEIEINSNIKNNYSKIPLSTSKEGDEVDMKTAQALIDLWSKPFASLSPNSLAVSTFKDYYTNFTGELATKGDELNTISQNQAIMAQNIDDQRQAIMGVSSDEELTNLIKFQHAYNASSRYITVIDQMLEHLLTRL
ncbi:flagellar hook-associated protein FlgK [Anaerocolumna sp. AGMB13020]|uniref:flagellar hook-associated protein FlgK n=1 Tax=Anaerocolumna sp. AGMB13020 TaxID=3081750 RepID=UPI002952BC9E|nr:flagellar hook-associated protein FlgK [Anaerocolumna sp. AGMB13020]WOO35140.1 flagellar hook-associated protein FlgK [Anaerocolumna sp. AGMB13020]